MIPFPDLVLKIGMCPQRFRVFFRRSHYCRYDFLLYRPINTRKPKKLPWTTTLKLLLGPGNPIGCDPIHTPFYIQNTIVTNMHPNTDTARLRANSFKSLLSRNGVASAPSFLLQRTKSGFRGDPFGIISNRNALIAFLCFFAVMAAISPDSLSTGSGDSNNESLLEKSSSYFRSRHGQRHQQVRRMVAGAEGMRGENSEVDYMWQKPHTKKVQGIIFLAHGCNHAGTDWWVPSEECPECLGLPEEVAIVEMARQKGLLVVTASSKDRKSKCWNKDLDGERISKVLKSFHDKFPAAPIFGLGSSSGGEMVGRIIPDLLRKGDGSPLYSGYITQNKTPQKTYDLFRPAVYMYLAKDFAGSKRAKEFISEYRKGPSMEVRLKAMKIEKDTFHTRIPHFVSETQSADIYKKLVKGFVLDEEKGSIHESPKKTMDIWQPLLKSLLPQDSLQPDESPVFEVLNVAWAHHQTTSDGVDDALDWLIEQAASRSKTKKPLLKKKVETATE